ncbi:MAG: hypothetical protein KJ871_16630 [Alphaproteobacteria bacterium]|nr:hypothetical protein [Alphaproteobacteria bacterium]MBU2082842.1 hypothetical protein [Alphaproteobacteria bacterium]MBU2142974.1 hypothetical protein [Alphaproteobacteria bacterium]MBU2196568.1 hypothetical protein [Alphaproteobacteria bacterium]
MTAPEVSVLPSGYTSRLRRLAASNGAKVFAATFVFVALFELLFKAHVIFSHALFLDDLFYFERSLSGLTFNGLEATQQDVPAGHGLDYTPNLQLYRALAGGLGDIVLLRLVHLAVFCFDAALLALVLLPHIKDRTLTVLTAAFAFMTPFSHILTIFANGSYFVWFFLFYLGAILAWRHMRFSAGDSRVNRTCLLAGALLGVLAALFVDSGILLLWPLLLFLLWNSRAWSARNGQTTAGLLTLLLAALSWHTIASIQHPYTGIAGRLDYAPAGMVVNGLYILSHMVWRYVEPMQYTGFRLERDNAYPALAVILLAVGALGLSFRFARTQLLARLAVPGMLPALGFFLLATLVSIGPYTIQTVTHIWHYFPHMLFFVPSVILLLSVTAPRWAGYAAILLCGALTVSSYRTTMPNYAATVERQQAIASFLMANANSMRDSRRLVVITDTRELASGVMNTDRFTSFARYVTGDPFLPPIEVYGPVAKSKRATTPAPDLKGATVIEMRDGFRSISIRDDTS